MNISVSQPPLWISHRGFKENAVENTVAAFKAAVNIGFSALETDLRLTRDRHIVLIHDPTLRRLTGDRRRVIDLTRRELESFRLADGEGFLFFDRFAEMFKNYYWTLDIKPQNGDQTIAALDAWAQENNFKAQLVTKAKFLTWRAGHENQLKRRFPGANFYARRNECWRAGLSVITGMPFSGGIKPGRTYALPPYIGRICLFKPSVVRTFHQKNARAIAFLPQTDFLTRKAVRARFDEIITNGAVV